MNKCVYLVPMLTHFYVLVCTRPRLAGRASRELYVCLKQAFQVKLFKRVAGASYVQLEARTLRGEEFRSASKHLETIKQVSDF